jgi:hypothetical protein
LDFKNFEGKYYPEKMRMYLLMNYKNTLSGEIVFSFSIDQLLVSTNIDTRDAGTISRNDMIDSDVSLEKMTFPYREEFWKNYTVIMDTPLDSAIRKDLEKHAALDERFQKEPDTTGFRKTAPLSVP